MAEKLTLARPYAKAAFSYAVENNCLEEWSTVLNNFSQISIDQRAVKLIKNPAYTNAMLVDFFVGFLYLMNLDNDKNKNKNNKINSRFVKSFSDFIAVIASYRRLELLPEIALGFNELELKYNKVSEVLIKSAVDITTEQKERLKQALIKKLDTKVNLSFIVDPSLIGGLIIKTGDLVIDSSVRGQLNRMLKQLVS